MLKGMRVLLDTNVFISREGNQVLPNALTTLLRTLQGDRIQILFHPASLEDLGHDRNGPRQQVAISKFASYPSLESPPNPTADPDYISAVGPLRNRNDWVDATLLYAVYRDAVDILVTEDAGLHHMASRIGVRERVLAVEEASLSLAEVKHHPRLTRPPALREDAVHNLRLSDEFFNSLRQDYGEPQFDTWFKNISREGRRCWVYRGPGGGIGALLIHKVETEPVDSDPPLAAHRRLKISTMKVSSYGQKIGELFIKLSVQYCLQNDIDELYLTHFTRPPDRLVDLIVGFGFERVAVTRKSEEVFLKRVLCDKNLLSVMSPVNVSTKHWPCFRDSGVATKYVIPIRPEFHERLFTDFGSRQTNLREHAGEFIIEGNTIRKAYLTHSKVKRIRPGDVVLFYRSRDLRGLTSLGVIESVYQGMTDPGPIMNLIRKRTVYTPEEVKRFAKTPTTVILFNWHVHFASVLGIDELKHAGILKGNPQSVVAITHNQYLEIKRRSAFDGRLAVS